MENTDTKEYTVLNGRAKVIFHGTVNQNRLKKSAPDLIKAALRAMGNDELLQEYLKNLDSKEVRK